jgi:GTP-binding protein Era
MSSRVAEHRAGCVALLGRPNSGKSTLLNRLVGQKLAIVTAKPQTTRSRILGITSLPAAQVLWLDTPGLHADRGRALNRALNALAEAAADDCDLALLLVDAERGLDLELGPLAERIAARGTPLLVVASRSDQRPGGTAGPGVDLHVSGRTGAGVPELLEAVVARLPVAPPFYDDPDQLTDRTLRWLAAECVREAVFEELEQELPYSTAVEIESFDESQPDCVRIRARLLVERESQKRIVVGSGGAQVKAIGKRARESLQTLLESRVHLALWVKVESDWARRPRRLSELGYR